MSGGAAEYCSFCNQPATAAWHESGTVAVCGECALEVLPILIADAATLHPRSRGDQIKKIVDRVEKRLWRAFALRLAKRADRK